MYYIIQTNEDEYLFDFDLDKQEFETTPMEIEARQFTSWIRADWIANRFGGVVVEIK